MPAPGHTYLRAGPRQPVVAGVIAGHRDRKRYAEVFSLPIRSVRLVASPPVVEARLRRRYSEHQASSLAWHLERHLHLTKELELNVADEHVIDTSHLTPRSVAEAVLEHFGQPARRLRRSTSPLTVANSPATMAVKHERDHVP